MINTRQTYTIMNVDPEEVETFKDQDGNYKSFGYGLYKGKPFDKFIVFDTAFKFDNIAVLVINFESLNEWWIVPLTEADENKFSDIGPFNKLDDVLIHYRLAGSND